MLKSTVQTLYFVGTISGDFGFGILADVFGRKPVIVPLLLILSLTGTIAALVPTLTGFIAVRFLNAMADMGIFSNIMCWLLEVVGGKGVLKYCLINMGQLASLNGKLTLLLASSFYIKSFQDDTTLANL